MLVPNHIKVRKELFAPHIIVIPQGTVRPSRASWVVGRLGWGFLGRGFGFSLFLDWLPGGSPRIRVNRGNPIKAVVQSIRKLTRSDGFQLPRQSRFPVVPGLGLPLRPPGSPPRGRQAGCDATDGSSWSWRCAARDPVHESCYWTCAMNRGPACCRCPTFDLSDACGTFSRGPRSMDWAVDNSWFLAAVDPWGLRWR